MKFPAPVCACLSPLLLTACAVTGGQEPSVRKAGNGVIPSAGLLVDLDADRDVTLETRPDLAGEGHEMGEVSAWDNQVKGGKIVDFRNFRPGGRPTLRGPLAQLNGHHAVVFDEDELVNSAEDALDHLTTGSGFTWAAVISAHRQVPTRAPYRNVNAFFGNLRNGPEFEGVWAGFDDDNTVSMNPRNSMSFGTWNGDNPKLTGPRLEEGRFHVVAGRLGAGRGAVIAELFVDQPKAVDRDTFVVVPEADPSKLPIGQEREALDHPGKEAFNGEIARMLIWERPLSDAEMAAVIRHLKSTYGVGD